MSRRSLLSQVTGAPLARPCDVPWSAMAGGEQQRHCAQCDRDVWDLSAMTAREAEIRLLNARELPCINYRVDGDGALISRPLPRVPTARLGLGAAAFVATTLIAPGHGSLGGRVAAADAAPPKPDPDAKKPTTTKRKFNPDDCPVVAAAPTAPGTAALTPSPSPPMRLGGAPPPPHEPPPAGTVEIKSKSPRDLTIDGVPFHAPSTVRLPPGAHEALLSDGKKTIRRNFSVKRDGTFVLDLDR